MSRHSFSSLLESYPEAIAAATIAPPEVPITCSHLTPASSSLFKAPTKIGNLDPLPDKTMFR